MKFAELRDDLYRRSPQSRQHVAEKASELADELGLAQLRGITERTQSQLAEAIGTTQSGVSRIERQQDLMVSTLYDYVAATGGVLRIIASYPEFETEIDLPVLRTRKHISTESPREFRVVWQNVDTRIFVHVGWLRFTGRQFQFQYTTDAQIDRDFEPFSAFPDFDKVYSSIDLFPFFSDRVAGAAVDRSLAASLGLRIGDATPVELLTRSWGSSIHDTIQVVPEPSEGADGVNFQLFLASGVSHIDESKAEFVSSRIAALRRNDPLVLRDEPSNPVNPRAVVLDAPTGAVGWVPNYLLDHLHKARDTDNDVQVFVEHANGPNVPWHLRLLCRLEVRSR
jgi:hypothetical protein